MTSTSSINQLINLYHEGKLSHAYLIETNNLEKCFQDLLEVIKQINCPKEYEANCQKCNLCNLLKNRFLPSFIIIEPDGKNIKKEQILDLKSRFSSIPTYTKENIYVIKEAEKLNAASANTMLKFLEEPESHIIGFFITNNINNVINTIKSRCETISIKYEEANTLDVTNNSYFDTVKNYLEAIETNPNESIFYNRDILLKNYKDRSDIMNIFQLILSIFTKVIEEKKSSKDIAFQENFAFLINKKMEDIIRIQKIIIEYIDELNYNVNIELFLDKFLIELSGKNE